MSLVIAEDLRKTYVNGEISIEALKGLSFHIEPTTFIFSIHDSKVVEEVEIIYTLQDREIVKKRSGKGGRK